MSQPSPSAAGGLLDRLRNGAVICAEGYLFECERRGYLQAGAFVPEVVLDHPEVVEQLHRDFVHAGSDVVQAFTYYGHREKLRLIGKEELLEPLNRQALAIAGRVAREAGALVAGNLCNTNVYDVDESSRRAVRSMFDEQAGWAAGAGVDFIIAETLDFCGEALLALEAARSRSASERAPAPGQAPSSRLDQPESTSSPHPPSPHDAASLMSGPI